MNTTTSPKMKIGPRIPSPAAQGVTAWFRQINGTYYRFHYIHAGWWGVGETGTIRVAKILFLPGGDYYTVKTFKTKS